MQTYERLTTKIGECPRLTIAWAALIAAAVLAAIDGMVRFPVFDAHIYIYVAEGILDGELPYRDRWDNKGPLSYVLYATAIPFGGVVGVWLLTVAFLAAAAYAAYRLLRSVFGTTESLFALAFFLVMYRTMQVGPALPEHLALPFLLLALLLFVRLRQGCERPALTAMAIGALGATVFLFKPSIVGVSLAVGIYWLFAWRDSWKHLLLGALSGVAMLLAAFAVMAALGNFKEFWDTYFVYGLAYGDGSLRYRLYSAREAQQLVGPMAFALAVAWCVALFYAFAGRLRGKRYEHLVKLALILAPIEFVLAVAPARPHGQFYLLLLPAIAIFLAFSLALVAERNLIPKNVLSAALLLVAACYMLHSIAFRLPYFVVNNYSTVRSQELVDYIRAETDSSDEILVWGGRVSIYWLADRKAPTRFFYGPPKLFGKEDSTKALRMEYIEDVTQARPVLIVDDEIPARRIFQGVRQDQSNTDRQYAHSDWFGQLFDFVEVNYEYVADFDGSALYRLKQRNRATQVSSNQTRE